MNKELNDGAPLRRGFLSNERLGWYCLAKLDAQAYSAKTLLKSFITLGAVERACAVTKVRMNGRESTVNTALGGIIYLG
jgi:hypothetical protein